MTPAQRLLGVLVALAVLTGLVWASRAQVTLPTTEAGVLRLAWRMRPERIENCRERTEAELAALPAHMRQKVVCDGVTAAYRLQVWRDDVLVGEQDVHGGGLRQDRPLYVSKDIPLPPGPARLRVRFERQGPAEPPAGQQPAAGRVSDSTRSAGAPPLLELEKTVTFKEREVILITYDSEERRLVQR